MGEKAHSVDHRGQNTGSGRPVSPRAKKLPRVTVFRGGRSISLPGQLALDLLAGQSRTADSIIGAKGKRRRKKKANDEIAGPND